MTRDENVFDRLVELAVLALRRRDVRCRILGTDEEVTLRPTDLREAVPGEIVTVRPRKSWQWSGHRFISGAVEAQRLDVQALGLTPLRLRDESPWDPSEEDWEEETGPLAEWWRKVLARGPRPSFEMEQVLPGEDLTALASDPILDANELAAAGDHQGAWKILMDLLAADLRCLDAHAHLGILAFEHRVKVALRHYRVGVAIGDLSLGPRFDGLLPWGRVDNRPFLRCLHGLGLCLWRLGELEEAAAVFERLLWLSPGDPQGIRFLLPAVLSGERWVP